MAHIDKQVSIPTQVFLRGSVGNPFLEGKYSPDQARDDHGKFTSDAGGGSDARYLSAQEMRDVRSGEHEAAGRAHDRAVSAYKEARNNPNKENLEKASHATDLAYRASQSADVGTPTSLGHGAIKAASSAIPHSPGRGITDLKKAQEFHNLASRLHKEIAELG